MTRNALIAYQFLTGLSDLGAGVLLCIAPLAALELFGLHPPHQSEPFVAYIGAFVLSTGLACLYGAQSLFMRDAVERIETVWLLTAFTRSAVAIYLAKCILTRELEPGWMTVAAFDGICTVIQAAGLRLGWLRNAS